MSAGAVAFAAVCCDEALEWARQRRTFGMPLVLISDRDPRFTAKFWQTFFSLSGTRLNMSSAHHPQTDGQTERTHRTLEEMLRHFVHDRQENWESLLPAVQYAYNTAVHSSTGHSPFFLNHHRQPRTPAALLAQLAADQHGRTPNNPAAAGMISAAREAMDRAKEFMRKQQQRSEAYADRSRKDVTFSAGDWVLLSTEHFGRRSRDGAKKLEPLYTQPIQIERMVSKVAAKLKLPAHMRIHPVLHVSMLEPYRNGEAEFPGRQPHSDTRDLTAPSTPDTFTVERFVDVRKTAGRVQYLVKWAGFPDCENSWEPSYALQEDLGRKTYLEFVDQLRQSQQAQQDRNGTDM